MGGVVCWTPLVVVLNEDCTLLLDPFFFVALPHPFLHIVYRNGHMHLVCTNFPF